MEIIYSLHPTNLKVHNEYKIKGLMKQKLSWNSAVITAVNPIIKIFQN